jgi:dipeptidyl-peptidase-4
MTKTILERYQQAGEFQLAELSNHTHNTVVHPHWVEGSHRFWYRRGSNEGWEYRVVDVDTGANTAAFDHAALANALTAATKQDVSPYNICFDAMTLTDNGAVDFSLYGYRWSYDPATEHCERLGEVPAGSVELYSPDGKKGVFVRDHNLWCKDNATGEEHALTSDGIERYGYASFGPSGLVTAIWSPDSNYLLTFQYDGREGDRYEVISYLPGQDKSLPMVSSNGAYVSGTGGESFERLRLVVIHVETGQVQSLNYPSVPSRDDHLQGFAATNGWSADSQTVYFIDKSVDHKTARLVASDIHTGATHVVFEESSETFVRMQHEQSIAPLFQALPDSNEFIWYSERNGWGHLYLYDLTTGQLKNPITDGVGLVRQVLHFDAERRELLLTMAARDPDRSPYYRGIYKANIDTGELTTLADGPFDYLVPCPGDIGVRQAVSGVIDSAGINSLSPCGEYMVYTRSRVDTIPESVLMDRNGREIMTVETADISGLPSDWVWPEPVMLKADDGETEIAGVVFRPPGFSPDQSYPVVDYSCSTRCHVQFPHGAFAAGTNLGLYYYRAVALAALGFIVVMIEGRATPLRDKAFQDHGHGDFAAANELKDHIAGMRQLAERYPYMDLDRVGIIGLEGFSNIVFSLLKYSDFYKVACVHYQEDCWDYPSRTVTDEWYGTADAALRAKKTHPADYVDTFDGKLLLTESMKSVSIVNTFRLIEALQQANKDFDQVFLPDLWYRGNNYNYRREWDYLVRHLQGVEPPKGFVFEDFLEAFEAIYFENAKKKNEFVQRLSEEVKEETTVESV